VQCKIERRTLAFTQLERNKAELRELMESEKALYQIELWITNIHDWADVRQARREVLCWEARCDRAEIALKRCLESTKDKNW
jgi:hypothetical protein